MMAMDEKALVAAYEAHDRILALPATDDDKRLIDAIISAYLSAAQPIPGELRLCSYCKTWNSKPCGEQCCWSPNSPTPQPVESQREPVAVSGFTYVVDENTIRKMAGLNPLAPPSPAQGTVERDREVAWLIERKENSATVPQWYAERVNGWHWWTTDAYEAKRFASEAEAKAYTAYQMIATDTSISVTEHVFLGTVERAEPVTQVGWAYQDARWIDEGRRHLCATKPRELENRKICPAYIAAYPPVDSDEMKALREALTAAREVLIDLLETPAPNKHPTIARIDAALSAGSQGSGSE